MTQRKLPDYSKIIIYKIVCCDLLIPQIYVGCTIDFNARKYRHKYRCKTATNNSFNFKLYKFINEHGGWNNFEMIEVEKIKCSDRREALARERYWYEKLNNDKLNSFKPFPDEVEYNNFLTKWKTESIRYDNLIFETYYQKNREERLEYFKKKYNENKYIKENLFSNI